VFILEVIRYRVIQFQIVKTLEYQVPKHIVY